MEAKLALKKSKRKDYYKILGIDKNASTDDIKKAYRKRAMVHHPGELENAFLFSYFNYVNLSLRYYVQTDILTQRKEKRKNKKRSLRKLEKPMVFYLILRNGRVTIVDTTLMMLKVDSKVRTIRKFMLV